MTTASHLAQASLPPAPDPSKAPPPPPIPKEHLTPRTFLNSAADGGTTTSATSAASGSTAAPAGPAHTAPQLAILLGVVSVALLGATFVGQLGGPILIGRLNDMLSAQYGLLAIRYSMLVVMGCSVLAGLSFLAASAFIVQDTRRAAAD